MIWKAEKSKKRVEIIIIIIKEEEKSLPSLDERDSRGFCKDLNKGEGINTKYCFPVTKLWIKIN